MLRRHDFFNDLTIKLIKFKHLPIFKRLMKNKGFSVQNLCLEKQMNFYNAHRTSQIAHIGTQQGDGILLCRRSKRPIDIILPLWKYNLILCVDEGGVR